MSGATRPATCYGAGLRMSLFEVLASPSRAALLGARRRAHGVLAAVACTAFLGCGAGRVPDPKSAAEAYAAAAARGDGDALYDLLPEKTKREVSRADVVRTVQAEREELKEASKHFAGKRLRVRARAVLRFDDGEEASLSLQDGVYRVDATSELLSGAPTPTLALQQFRRALARRSYVALLRVLTPETRAAVEAEVRALVEGLEHPEELQVHVAGEAATIHLAGGHIVKLKRDAGVWFVDDFD